MPTSYFKKRLRVCLLIALLILPLSPKSAKAELVAAKHDDWTTLLFNDADVVINYTHGSIVHGHRFGFAKLFGSCNTDLFWISWSSGDKEVKKFINTNVLFKFEVDGKAQEIPIKFLTTYEFPPLMTLLQFTNVEADSSFKEFLQKGKSIGIEIVGPEKVVDHMDVPSDSFSLKGLEESSKSARRLCTSTRM